MNVPSEEFSRPIAAAQTLGDAAQDGEHFVDRPVLLTGEVAVLKTCNGAFMAEDGLRLLVRSWKRVTVYVPKEMSALLVSLQAIAKAIEFAEHVAFLDEEPSYADYDAILSIGIQARAELAWTVINSNGWLARVSSSGTSLESDCGQDNPLGALAAASLGVADVFKRTAKVRFERAELFDALTFSCYDFITGHNDAGPPLPGTIRLPPTLFLGQGAIGNAITLLAGQLPLEGKALLLDKDHYGMENLGTCVLLGPAAAGEGYPKANWNLNYLKARGSKLELNAVTSDIEAAKKVVEPYLGLLVNGLDRVEPRYAAQDLWPDAIVDGALREFQCQFVSYDHDAGFACLRCLFQLPDGPDPLEAQARATGLPRNVLQRNLEITKELIEMAPEDKRPFLQARIGKPACSVAADMAAITEGPVKEGFAPSVPFVAAMSGVLVMAEVIRRLIGQTVGVRKFYFDVLVGPERGARINEQAKSTCRCQTRKGPIERQRANWQSAAAS